MPLGGIPQPQKGLPVGTGNVTIINRPSQPKPLVRVQQGLYQSTNYEGAQWLSGRVLDMRLRDHGFESPLSSLCCVLEQDTLILY